MRFLYYIYIIIQLNTSTNKFAKLTTTADLADFLASLFTSISIITCYF